MGRNSHKGWPLAGPVAGGLQFSAAALEFLPQLEVVLGDRGRDQGVRGRHLQLQDHPWDLPDLRQGAKAQGCVCIMNEKYLFLMWGESDKNRSLQGAEKTQPSGLWSYIYPTPM